MVPALELVGAAHRIQHLLSRFETQMVGVVEAKATPRVLKLLWRKALERGLCCHGHKHGKIDGPVGQRHDGGARTCRLGGTLAVMYVQLPNGQRQTHGAFCNQLEGEGRRRR